MPAFLFCKYCLQDQPPAGKAPENFIEGLDPEFAVKTATQQ